MVIITTSTLYRFAEIHADAVEPINDWAEKVKQAEWNNFNDVKQSFRSADFVGNDRYVFNLKGNRYRVVVMIHFKVRTLYVRFIGTHADYDRIDVSTI